MTENTTSGRRRVAGTNTTPNSVQNVAVEAAKLFDAGKMYTLAAPITWISGDGRNSYTLTQVTGEDLNYAVRTVYAEAGGLDNGTQEERKAMADMLTNRIGASGISAGIADTYTEVVQSRNQFESYNNGSSMPKFRDGDHPGALRGGSIKSWNYAYDAVATEIKEMGGLGPTYPYTSNRSAVSGDREGWTTIGASRFKVDSCGWKWKRRQDGSMGWVWEGIGRMTTPRPAGRP